jgi:hypothetical protein
VHTWLAPLLLSPPPSTPAECSHAVHQSAGISDILAAGCSVRSFSSSSRSARSQSSRFCPCKPPRSTCISYARCRIASGLGVFCFRSFSDSAARCCAGCLLLVTLFGFISLFFPLICQQSAVFCRERSPAREINQTPSPPLGAKPWAHECPGTEQGPSKTAGQVSNRRQRAVSFRIAAVWSGKSCATATTRQTLKS